jgi:integrase
MSQKNENRTSGTRRKRSSNRYWREIKGILYARLQYKDSTGKPKEKVRKITDKRTARSVVEEMRRELEGSGEESLRYDRLTFRHLAKLFAEARLTPVVYANGVKVSGLKSRLKPMVRMLSDHFDTTLVRAIRPRDLHRFKDHRLNSITRYGKTRNIATVNRELSILRTMFTFAVENDYIIQNPFSRAKGIIVISAEKERDRVLSHEEEARLLDVCIAERVHLRPILICALDTAMRGGEIFKIRWRDVNLYTGEIFIPQTNTKTERSRVVGITPRLREELERLQTIYSGNPDDLVFGISNTVKRSWKTACKLAGIEDFRLHDCRHTATTRMIASGSPHTEVMKITGHSQMKTFLRYLNVTSESVNRTANRLADYLAERSVESIREFDAVN